MTNSNSILQKHTGFILIADDDLDDQELLGDAFRAIDKLLALEFIHNGNKVVKYLEKLDDAELPSLIVLDYNMPELNGVEILRVLNDGTRYKPIPKIIWSTSNSIVYKKLCLELGAADYIVKPSDLASFESIAHYMLSLIV
jgi:CheY-like chemotaxis protein